MRKYVFIGVGGFFGAILRVIMKGIPIYHYHENIPINTLIINVTGAFLLGLLLTVAFEVWDFHSDYRLGIATGFLGAFTTFSTMCKETVALIDNGDYFSALSYITVSTMLGLAAAFFGMILAREVASKLFKSKEEDGK